MAAVSTRTLVSSLLCHGPELATHVATMQDTSNVSSQTPKGCKVEGVRQMSLDSSSSLPSLNALISLTRSSGQALVEFTFTFLILLIVAWIPADFGLAFYSGQLAHNAAREGARIAAADTTLVSGTTSCVMPSCTANIFKETAGRLSSALLPAATITLQLDPDTGTNCNRMVTVTVSGTYNFFFYQLLHWAGVTTNLNNTPITRQTRMRWEGQSGC
jgi:Flp pilus assembly protein TadG